MTIHRVYWRIIWPIMNDIGRMLLGWSTRRARGWDKPPYRHRMKVSYIYGRVHFKLQEWMQ